jgi:hypothetical protein
VFTLLDVGVDFGLVVVVVGECRMDLGEINLQVGRHNFLGAHAHPLVADCDVLDLDAVPVDSRLAATRTRGADDAGHLKGLGS